MQNLKQYMLSLLLLSAVLITRALPPITCTYFYRNFTLSSEATQIINRIIATNTNSSYAALTPADTAILQALDSYKKSRSIDSLTLLKLVVSRQAIPAFLYMLEHDNLDKHAAYLVLNYAVEQGIVESVKFFIEEAGFGVNTFQDLDPEENSFLHKAVEHNKLDLTEYLLTQNIQLNAINKDGETPLDRADRLERTNIKKLLLTKDAQYSAKVHNEKLQKLASYIEYKLGIERVRDILADKRINLNASINHEQHKTLLALANHQAEQAIIELLIQHGAQASTTNTKTLEEIPANSTQLKKSSEHSEEELDMNSSMSVTQEFRDNLLAKKLIDDFIRNMLIVEIETEQQS